VGGYGEGGERGKREVKGMLMGGPSRDRLIAGKEAVTLTNFYSKGGKGESGERKNGRGEKGFAKTSRWLGFFSRAIAEDRVRGVGEYKDTPRQQKDKGIRTGEQTGAQ